MFKRWVPLLRLHIINTYIQYIVKFDAMSKFIFHTAQEQQFCLTFKPTHQQWGLVNLLPEEMLYTQSAYKQPSKHMYVSACHKTDCSWMDWRDWGCLAPIILQPVCINQTNLTHLTVYRPCKHQSALKKRLKWQIRQTSSCNFFFFTIWLHSSHYSNFSISGRRLTGCY